MVIKKIADKLAAAKPNPKIYLAVARLNNLRIFSFASTNLIAVFIPTARPKILRILRTIAARLTLFFRAIPGVSIFYTIS